MSLAHRVRDFRYSKGWGPDELASRAAISRTALYQIESGKTELPRAGTLRRIAMALDVSMETLLGHTEAATPARPPQHTIPVNGGNGGNGGGWTRSAGEWFPSEGAALTTPNPRAVPRYDVTEGPRYAADSASAPSSSFDLGAGLANRERELVFKFHELLGTSLGDGLARVVEEAYRLMPMAIPATATASATSRAF